MAEGRVSPTPISVLIVAAPPRVRLRRAFVRRGHHTRVASVDDAIAVLDEKVEAVVLSAPRRGALELCRRIKTRFQIPFLPVVALLPRPARFQVDPTAPDAWLPVSAAPRDVIARTEELVRVRRAEGEPARLNRALAELAAENGRLYDRARRDAEATSRLLRELQHRVRNNLSAIQSLLVMERHRDPPRALRDALDVAITRLRSMAAIHDSTQAHGGEVGLAAMAQQIARGARDVFDIGGRTRCEVRGDAMVPARAGGSLAIVLNELITNALKHADAANVAVEIERGDGEVRIVVADDGRGMPADPGRGSGLMISRAVVGNELRGTLEVEAATPGTRLRITMPLAPSQAASPGDSVEWQRRAAEPGR
ncbi:MAG: sensor histidine kinase [Gemmatimonadaceae bacterium]